MKKKCTKTLKEIAKELNIAEGTIFNWRKEKQKLYEIVIDYYSENITVEVNEDFLNDYNELNEDEKEMYRLEIKARIMRKKL